MALDPNRKTFGSGFDRGGPTPTVATNTAGGNTAGGDESSPETATTTTVVEQMPPQFPPGFGPVLLERQRFANQQLQNLAGMRGQNFVAPFNQDQQNAFNSARFLLDRPGQFNNFLRARMTGRDTAIGNFGNQGLNVLEALQMRPDSPPEAQAGLSALGKFASGQLPGGESARLGIGRLGALSRNVPGDARGFEGLRGLADTASGRAVDAPGFQDAFEAAVRRAQPNISSQFALSGRTGGGLENVAQTQAAADAFAGLFNQERQRQVAASQGLTDFMSQQRGRQTDAARTLADFLGRQQGQQIAAATPLAQFSESGRQRQLQAAIAGSDDRRLRQALRLQGANALPGLTMAGPRAELEIGNQIQAQRQRELEAPLRFQQALAGLATGSLQSIPAVSGGSTSTTTRPLLAPGQAAGGGPSDTGSFLTGALGGAGTGFAIGGPVGAGIGGLLGGLGSIL